MFKFNLKRIIMRKINSIGARTKAMQEARRITGRPEVDFSNVPENIQELIERVYDNAVLCESKTFKGRTPDNAVWVSCLYTEHGHFELEAEIQLRHPKGGFIDLSKSKTGDE
jgi:hypothetical protein